MIDYVILHYNRPYLLELHVDLLRHYFDGDVRIVVLDNGSNKNVLKGIKKLSIDEVYSSQELPNDSVCCLVNHLKTKGVLVNDYMVYSEDDFIPIPEFVKLPFRNRKGQLLFDSKEKFCVGFTDMGYNFLQEATLILQGQLNIKQVQLARPVNNMEWWKIGVTRTGGYDWKVLDHTKVQRYYYVNWPWMMRTEDFMGKVVLPSAGTVESMELRVAKSICSGEGFGGGDWAVTPSWPLYLHVGYSISHQPDTNLNPDRIKARQDFREVTNTKRPWKEVMNGLCELWCSGELKLKAHHFLHTDVQTGFLEAFSSLRDKI